MSAYFLNGLLDKRTSISVTREIPRPLHKRAALVVAAGDGVALHRAEDAAVSELRLGRDDAVGDVVVDSLHPSSARYHPLSYVVS